MNYADGQEVALGDLVSISVEVTGTVVLLIEEGIGEEEHPVAHWAYLGCGILVKSTDL